MPDKEEAERVGRIKDDIWREINRANKYQEDWEDEKGDYPPGSTYLKLMLDAVDDAWEFIENWLKHLSAEERQAMLEYFIEANRTWEKMHELEKKIAQTPGGKKYIDRKIEQDRDNVRRFERMLRGH